MNKVDRSPDNHLLEMQGFNCSTGSDITGIENWLRFTPALSTLWILTGTVLGSPPVLWLFSVISYSGYLGKQHPFDYVYNLWVRKISGTRALPENPKPRKFAMLLAAIWSAITGFLFVAGFTTAGLFVGLLLTGAGGLVASNHFCLGSWMYRFLERFIMKKA